MSHCSRCHFFYPGGLLRLQVANRQRNVQGDAHDGGVPGGIPGVPGLLSPRIRSRRFVLAFFSHQFRSDLFVCRLTLVFYRSYYDRPVPNLFANFRAQLVPDTHELFAGSRCSVAALHGAGGGVALHAEGFQWKALSGVFFLFLLDSNVSEAEKIL